MRPRSASSSSPRLASHLLVDAAKQMLGVGVAIDDGFEYGPTALAHDVGQHEAELEVGVFEDLLDALDVGGASRARTACACG